MPAQKSRGTNSDRNSLSVRYPSKTFPSGCIATDPASLSNVLEGATVCPLPLRSTVIIQWSIGSRRTCPSETGEAQPTGLDMGESQTAEIPDHLLAGKANRGILGLDKINHGRIAAAPGRKLLLGRKSQCREFEGGNRGTFRNHRWRLNRDAIWRTANFSLRLGGEWRRLRGGRSHDRPACRAKNPPAVELSKAPRAQGNTTARLPGKAFRTNKTCNRHTPVCGCHCSPTDDIFSSLKSVAPRPIQYLVGMQIFFKIFRAACRRAGKQIGLLFTRTDLDLHQV